MNETNFVRSDLRFLLPIQLGQTIAVLGKAPELVNILHVSGFSVINILSDIDNGTDGNICFWDPKKQQSMHINTASIDHVLVPLLFHQQTDWMFAELTRIMKPGGYIYLGFHGNYIWHRIGVINNYRKIQSKALFSVDAMKTLVNKSGFGVLNVYGVYKDHFHPRYLVPLENPKIAHYLFEQLIVSRSWSTEMLRRIVVVLIRMDMQSLIFRDFGLVAQLSEG